MKWLFWATLLLIVSLLLGFGLLAYAMYALLGVLLVSRLLTWLWIHNLSAERECNRQIAQVGDTVAVVIQVKNTGLLPIAWVLLEDVLPTRALIFEPPNLRLQGRREQLISLRGRGRATMFYQLECNRRGFYQIGPLVMETGDLFGLHRRFRIASQPHFLLVYPQVIPLAGYEIASRRPIGEIRISHRLFEDPTRIAGVRPYESGDPLNRIHWRATARTGQLHSKIYEPSTIAGITIVLDFHTASHAAKDEPYRSELAITAAASLANAVYEMGQQVGLVSNCRDAADRIRSEGWDVDLRSRQAAQRIAGMQQQSDRLRPVVVETRRGAEQLLRILETLARAELTDGLTFAQLIADHGNRLSRDASVVAILTRLTDDAAIALGSLRRRGFAVSVILNMYDGWDYAEAAGALAAQGITAYHLPGESAIADVCRNHLCLSRME
ncbi:MAG TPA: DUF58 domain-containing protein [Pirellulales bacterium]|jgi:uncharacterized repeat protein (TIGR01451 family)|nr:DUF58 domain-containing protein [Pirellulales bacterium]